MFGTATLSFADGIKTEPGDVFEIAEKPVRAAAAQRGQLGQGRDGEDQGALMYGLIGRIRAIAGKRAELAAILVPGDGGMPGCLSYIVAEAPDDPDALWVTEVWVDQAAHKASLQLPGAGGDRQRTAADRGVRQPAVTKVLGGIGL